MDIVAKDENPFIVLFTQDLIYEDLPYVDSLKVIYPNTKKEDIVFNITEIVYNEVDSDSSLVFETNITNIEKIKTAIFEFQSGDDRLNCYFIKQERLTKLYMVCIAEKAGTIDLINLLPLELNDIHYKYNFKFLGQRIEKSINITEPEGTFIIYVLQEKLDFTKSDALEFTILTDKPSLLNMRLNKDGNDLECTNAEMIKKCIVKKDHFEGKKNGYYLIYHRDKSGQYIANYEYFGVEVVLNSGKINEYSWILFVLFFLFTL